MFAPKKGPHLTSLHPDRFKKLSPCTSIPVCQYALPHVPCTSASMLSPRPFSPALCVGSCAVWTQQQSSSQTAVKQSLASGCKGRRGRSCDGITVMEHVGKGSWSVRDSFFVRVKELRPGWCYMQPNVEDMARIGGPIVTQTW